jgi:DNA topoisomerase VI subunit A
MNHQSDCCGTVSECEQLERLIQSLLTNDQLDDGVKSKLNDVYYYSQSGKYSSDLDQHITNHQQQLSQWVSDLDSYT